MPSDGELTPEMAEMADRTETESADPALTLASALASWSLAPLVRLHCESAIRAFGMARAVRELGVPRTTLYRWRKKWKEGRQE